MPFCAPLPNRSAVFVEGVDSHGFLQNLLSHDLNLLSPGAGLYAALLTPQGKFLHDLFLTAIEGGVLLDVEAARAEDLCTRLTAYRLRAKVTIREALDDYDLWAIWGADCGQMGYADPRLSAIGRRAFLPKGQTPPAAEIRPFADYDRHRLSLGVADGSRDLEVGKSTLIEGNFDYLNGIDWKKGCYIGQELTARLHYRGLAKKRLFPVHLEAPIQPGAAISREARAVGEMRSSTGMRGLALLDIGEVQRAIEDQAALTCGQTQVFPEWPAWLPRDILKNPQKE